MAYRKIYDGTMTDPWVKSQPLPERYLWMYLLACDEAKSEGLFRPDIFTASQACSMEIEDLLDALAGWTEEGRIVYDREHTLVWFPKASKYWRSTNPKEAKGVANRIRAFRSSYLIGLVWGSAALNDDGFLTDALGELVGELTDKEPIPASIQKRFPEASKLWVKACK